MKINVKKAAIIGCLVFCGACGFAQLPPDGTPPPPPAKGTPGPPPPMRDGGPAKGRRPLRDGLKALTTINGKIIDYTTNARYVYDGFSLQTDSQTLNVKFSPHMGDAMMKAAKKGETISVSGFNEVGPTNINEFHLVTAKVGNIQLIDTPTTPPTIPTAPEQATYSGSISEFRKNLEGMFDGILLNNKVVIDVPPHVMEELQGLLKVGQKLDVTGFKDAPQPGVVMARNNTVIHPQTISLNGQTYLVR